MAKDYAALLALFQLQKTIPLERKLPEPYSTTWLQMLADEKEKSQNKKPPSEKSSSGKSSTVKDSSTSAMMASSPLPSTTVATAELPQQFVPPVHEGDKIAAGKKSAVGVAAEIDPRTADWLCERCGSQNFNKLQSGAVRTKCFRCSAAKADTCILVTPNQLQAIASASAVIASHSVKGKVLSSSGKDPAFESSTAASNSIKKVAATPAPVLNLRARETFSSKAAASKAVLDQSTERKRRRDFFEALDRANQPMTVFLSPTLRRQLEAVLNMEVTDDSNGSDSMTVEDFVSDFAKCGFLPPRVCRVSAKAQVDQVKEVIALLCGKGFAVHDALRSLMHLQQLNEDTLEEFADEYDEQLDTAACLDKFRIVLMEGAVRVLCTRLDEHSLPEEFNPRRNEARKGLVVIASGSIKAAAGPSATLRKIMHNATELFPEEEDAQKRYLSLVGTARECGWSEEEIFDALETVHDFLGTQNDLTLIRTLLYFFLLEAIHKSIGGEFNKRTVRALWKESYMPLLAMDSATTADADAHLAEEIESLEAILAERVSVQTAQIGTLITITVDLDASTFINAKGRTTIPCVLEAIIPVTLQYPDHPPIFLLRPLTEHAGVNKAVLLTMQYLLLRKSLSMSGEPMLFQIYGFVQDGMPQGTGSNISQLKTILMNDTLKERVVEVKTLLLEEEEAVEDNPIEPLSVDGSDGSTTRDGQGSSDSQSGPSKGALTRNTHPFWRRLYSKTDASRSNTAKTASRERQALPAWKSREEFLAMYIHQKAIVVTGETGCGKTTQIPQFIHEQFPDAKIVICQPRR